MATLSAREGAIKILEKTNNPMTLADILSEWERRGWGAPVKCFSGCLSKAKEIKSTHNGWTLK